MLEWLGNEYLAYYNGCDSVQFEEFVLSPGHHTLCDERSCKDCSQQACHSQPEILKLHNDTPIVSFDIELFLSRVDKLHIREIHDRCDLLIADEETKLVLCEFTCSAEKYINPYLHHKNGMLQGKRAKAYKQLMSVIEELEAVPNIKPRLNNYAVRIGLFAYRVKNPLRSEPDAPSPERIKLRDSLSAFKPSPKLSSPTLLTDMGHGFQFRQIRYPDAYYW